MSHSTTVVPPLRRRDRRSAERPTYSTFPERPALPNDHPREHERNRFLMFSRISRLLPCWSVIVLVGAAGAATAWAEPPQPLELLKQSRRVVFLGDSITAAGRYVALLDAWMMSQRWERAPQMIDAGLPSETVSGLSEEGHAGGKFPRPDLAERLERVLAATKPDLVVACYGINCGIYQPFDEQRFARYQRGMKNLKAQAEKSGAKFVVMTPPFYDDQRAPRPFSYNAVLDRYSEWLLEQRKQDWQVVDLHGPMTRKVLSRRKADPQFTFQPDGVHPNDDGHWFIAQQLIRWFGDDASGTAVTPKEMFAARNVPESLLILTQQRVNLLRDAYVSAAEHLRPGVAKGLPVAEAEMQAADIGVKIQKLIEKKPE
jgi:lysophospholipase L1-like esterase